MSYIDFGYIIYEWQNMGVFEFVLPFLLIFALTYGILSKSTIFSQNNAVNLVVSLAIGLMAIQLPMSRDFFTEVFPRMGIALASILVIVILAAVFIDPKKQKGWFTGFAITGVVFGVLSVLYSFNVMRWVQASFFFTDHLPGIVAAVIFIFLIIMIATSNKKGNK